MSPRSSLPRIDPSDLRDQADEARIARVWSRIEADLPEPRSSRRRPSTLVVALAAATLGVFSTGLLAGKVIWGEHPQAPVYASPSPDRTDIDVLATGTLEKTYPLPLGGQITLSPGTIVEVQRNGDLVTLRLNQGEATLDAAAAKNSASLAIVTGDATLAAQAGSALKVRRNKDDMDVIVSSGAVSISSPAGSQRLERGQHADKVPIHATTASLPQNNASHPRGLSAARHPNDPPIPEQHVAAAPAEWRVAWEHNPPDAARAYDLLARGPGGVIGAIDSATSAEEIFTIHDVALSTRDNAAAMHAYQRLTESFPQTQQGELAAQRLAEFYDKQGNADLAAKYRGMIHTPALADDSAICAKMKTEAESGHKDEAARLALDYASKYPNGQCREDAQRIKAEAPAPESSAAPPTPSPPAVPAPATKPSSDKPAP